MRREDFTLVIESTGDGREHFHQDIELIFVLDGKVLVGLENKESQLKTGDIYVVNSNVKHHMIPEKDSLVMRLLIRYQTLEKASDIEEMRFWCDSSVAEDEGYSGLRRLLRRMLRHYVENREYINSFAYLSDCYGILEHLMVHFLSRPSEIRVSDDGDRYEDRIRQINNYIYQNYDHPISIKELSEKLYLSNGYLSRFFKKNYGMNFAQYLMNVRVYRAADDLRYTDEPITRIAYNNGFTSAALFNKVFKKTYGQTPSEFRKAATEKVEEEKDWEAQERRLEKIFENDDDERLSENEELDSVTGNFDVRFFEPLKQNWSKLINFGDAENLLHSSVREHLMLLRQALDFEYVRFTSLFSEAFFIRPDQAEFNFTQVDSVLDFILEQGMKPFIELGVKPKFILYQIGEKDVHRESTMSLYTVEQWEHLMTAFMRHLTKRYGQHVLADWCMELWFEEDRRLVPEEEEHYIRLFDVTMRAIKSCNENIRVGGYGIRMDTGHDRRLAFLKKWNESACRPDFLTIMYYGYERRKDELDKYASRVTDNEALIHEIVREKEVIRNAGMSDVPLILDEWNLTPSVRNYINDTSFKGAYIIKNTIDLYGEFRAMGYAVGTDRQDLSFDTNEPLFGGGGLLTKDAVMKPAAFAYDFLNRLYPYFVGKGTHFLATTDRHENYAIVCHNQQTLNYNYFLTPEISMEKSSMWKYYREKKKLDIHLRLDGVVDGMYRVKIYRINDMNGSVLEAWSDMDFEPDLSRNDIKYLRRFCEPNMTIRKVEAHEGILDIEDQLMPNEIMLIRISYVV